MAEKDERVEQVDEMLASTEMADALENNRFRRFLDRIPIAIAVSELGDGKERIVYANPEFERLTGIGGIEGKGWSVLDEAGEPRAGHSSLAAIIGQSSEEPEEFCLRAGAEPLMVEVYSHVIDNDDGVHAFRLAAILELRAPKLDGDQDELRRKLLEKDLLLREVQHRVKNNLQMIAALIRLEARTVSSEELRAPFNRLAGRIEALHLLYQTLANDKHDGAGDMVDLGAYIGSIASAVMKSHAVEGIRLDLRLDAYPVSLNVAMPAGLVVNELLTNALKYAFVGRDGGTITLHSVVEEGTCRVAVADDGVGLPEGAEWPEAGKLSSLILDSLRENAKAEVKVESSPGGGMRVTMSFTRADAEPETA